MKKCVCVCATTAAAAVAIRAGMAPKLLHICVYCLIACRIYACMNC